MNILVANLSLLTKNEVHHYEVELKNCSKDVITAVHTNECILKCVNSLNDVINSGGIGRIILLVSNSTLDTKMSLFKDMTTIEYFESIVEQECPTAEIIQVKTEKDDKSDRDTSAILSEICAAISKEDIIYIDGAGGKRTTSNIIQLLAKILSYTGINSPLTLYANIQNTTRFFITDNSEFVRMTDLGDGFHEFMTTGKADQLQKCVGTDMNNETSRLIDKICEFSDKIRIGDIDNLDSTILHLKELLETCRKTPTNNSIESVILQQFIPVFDEKLLGSQHDKVDYPKIIAWCLDNVLIQQALTIFVEKIPTYIFDKGIIKYEGNLEEYKKNNDSKSESWESQALYKDLFGENNSKGQKKDSEFVEQLKISLKDNNNSKASEIVKNVYEKVNAFNNPSLNSKGSDEKTEIIRKCIQDRNLRTYQRLINTMCNDESLLRRLLGLQENDSKSSKEQTISKKFRKMETFKEGKNFGSKFMNNVRLDDFIKVLYSYIYVKALRNQINHASSNENLTDAQKRILENYDFTFTGNIVKDIHYNIKVALEHIIRATEKRFQVNDIIPNCKCIAANLVHIDGCNYNVKLEIPTYLSACFYINKEIKVKVMKVSNKGYIELTKLQF